MFWVLSWGVLSWWVEKFWVLSWRIGRVREALGIGGKILLGGRSKRLERKARPEGTPKKSFCCNLLSMWRRIFVCCDWLFVGIVVNGFGHFQVGFSIFAFIADCHVHDHSGHVAFHLITRLKGVTGWVFETTGGFSLVEDRITSFVEIKVGTGGVDVEMLFDSL